MATVQSNVLVFHLKASAPDAKSLVAQARAQGVLINAFGPRTLRMVTHLDVSHAQVQRAAGVLASLLSGAVL